MRASPSHPVCIARYNADCYTVIDYYDGIENRRVLSNVSPGYLRGLLPAGPPDKGEPWEDIQKDIETKIMPGLTHWCVFLPFISKPLLPSIGSPPISWPSILPPPPILVYSVSSTPQPSQLQPSTGSALQRSRSWRP